MNAIQNTKTAALFLLCCVAMFAQASAIEILDDFEDGMVTDGSPVSWTNVAGRVSGDLVIVGSDSNIHTSNAVVDPEPGWSIRARARIGGGYYFGLMADVGALPGGGFSNGWSMLSPDGSLSLGSVFDVLISVPTDLNAVQEDVMLQLDAFESSSGRNTEFKAWAWRPGEPRPKEPMVEYPIVLAGDSVPTLWVRDLSGGATEASFRWVAFSSERSIPEPSTVVLGVCVAAAVLLARRRHD